MQSDHQTFAQWVSNAVAGGTVAASWVGWLPPTITVIASLVALCWYIIQISESETVRRWTSNRRAKKIAMVIGTTGLQPTDHAIIDQAAADIPILQAPNMSLGVNLLFKVAGEVAKLLGDDYDIEIVEG